MSIFDEKDVSEVRRRIMRANVHKDTKPELEVRSFLHKNGYRYRLHYSRLPGKPDIVFPSRKKLIDVRGCFWHDHRCARHSRLPKARSHFWTEKLRANSERDHRNEQLWVAAGWTFQIVWECELKDKKAELERSLIDFLKDNPA
ncbi:very short patch repair endonuclease [Peteryoungia ipomoeae]|nr:very short patch repair endonuclease [Peteryoungia ipomoeae]